MRPASPADRELVEGRGRQADAVLASGAADRIDLWPWPVASPLDRRLPDDPIRWLLGYIDGVFELALLVQWMDDVPLRRLEVHGAVARLGGRIKKGELVAAAVRQRKKGTLTIEAMAIHLCRIEGTPMPPDIFWPRESRSR